jgi:CMP-N-acetylneuraminic acid synthetase
MRIATIVPIKLNNERFPGKNIKLLGKKPLISYCLDMLKEISLVDAVYVYCSSQEICDYLHGDAEFLKRPDYLDLPTSNFSQIFEEFSNRVYADIYIYAHATAPFIKPDTVVNGLNAVISGKYDSAFCAERIQDFLWLDGEPLNFDAANVPRSQDLPVIYRETSGVYIFKKEVFVKYHRRIGKRPLIMEVDHREAVDINTYDDFRFAEQLLNIKGEQF